MANFTWSDQHFLLTGASGGLGQALAQALVARGARVTLIARPSEALAALAEQLSQPYLALDLSDPSSAAKLLSYAQQSHDSERPVSGIIHNAGRNHCDWFAAQPWQVEQQLLELNLLAPMRITHALLPYLQQRQAASLVFVGSVFGALGYPAQASYCASKAGLARFAESLQREHAGSSLRIMHCAPRAIATKLNSAVMERLNQQLGQAVDDPAWVAERICQQIEKRQLRQVIGWPERLFVKLNALLPAMVDQGLRKPQKLLSQLLQETR